jgi:protein-L-isoaspartate(D-aspartate) O-methyltransferase
MKAGFGPETSRQARASYASRILHLAGIEDARIEKAFASVPLEALIELHPWCVIWLGV